MFRKMMMIAAVCLPAAAAHAQVTCDPNTFVDRCEETSVVVCDNVTNPAAPVEFSFNCGDDLVGATCGEQGCVGACTGIGVNCVAASGGTCQGLAAFNDADTTNDFVIGCPGDETCEAGPNAAGTALEDTCVPHMGPACAPGDDPVCAGTIWSICIGDAAGTLSLTSNIAVDCAAFGVACGQTPCECDEQCGAESQCVGGFCDYGNSCVFPPDPDVQCPSEGEGEGEGEGEDDGGRDDEEADSDDGGSTAVCGAFTFGGTPLMSLVVLAGALGLRRRRR